MPGPTDRATFVGQTGTGKTTLAEVICGQKPYVVALDPKGMLKWPGYELHRTLDSLTKSSAPRLIYRPVYEELEGDDNVMDLFFQWILRRKNTTLYIDEIYAVARGNTYPLHLGACMTRGREIGVVVYTSTQRPASVPTIIFSEAEHVYCFNLRMARDRERVEEMTGVAAAKLRIPKHRFFYAPQEGEIAGPLKLRLSAA